MAGEPLPLGENRLNNKLGEPFFEGQGMVPPGPFQENRLEKFRRQKTGELAEKQADFFLPFPSQSAFLARGAKPTGLPVAGAAAPIEVAEGGGCLGRQRSLPRIIISFSSGFDKRRVDGL